MKTATKETEKDTKSKKYQVYVDDNFHFNDENYRYKHDEFDTCEEAVSECKKIVDEFMEKAYKKGMSFDELYGGYTGFGEDPFIQSDDKKCEFSAWNYAKKRSKELCGEYPHSTQTKNNLFRFSSFKKLKK